MRRNQILSVFLSLLAGSILLAQLDLHVPEEIRLVSRGFSATLDWLSGRDRLARLDVLNRILYHIKESYVDPERVKPEQMFRKALDNISSAVAEVRVLYPSQKKAVLLVDQERKEFDTDLPTLFALHASLSDALRFVRSHKRSDVSDADLEITAIHGVLSTLDPHSVYLTKELFKEVKASTTGVFGGLGIEIGIRDDKLTVLRPLKDTPAFRAGLAPGDIITKIGEDSTRNMNLEEAVERMRGVKGTKVTITVSRKEWPAEREFTLTRDQINIVSVESELLPEKIGYVKVKSFQKNTGRELSQNLQRLHELAGGSLNGFVLDLRNDPGGLLDQAIAVADKFFKDGVIVTTVDMTRKARREEKFSGRGTELKYPMVVLVNGASASASEIVAGALQRQGRAVVIGERTFGKGTVQSIFDLPEKSALKLTVAKYLTPGDISIQSIGIVPEIRTAPATISTERIDIFPNHTRISEMSLEHHFDNPESSKISFEPIVSLRYLEERTDREIIDENTHLSAAMENPGVYAEALQKDFVVQIASKILRNTPSAQRTDLILTAKGIAGSVERQESAKIGGALSKRGIDWTDAPKEKTKNCGLPRARAKVVEHETGAVHSGETIRFAVTLENPGPCTLYQAWATSASKNYLLNDHEFLFGKVPPTSSATRDVKIEIPKSAPTGLSSVVLQFKEARGVVPKRLRSFVAVASSPAPQFVFNYDVRDLPKPDEKKHLNGLIEPGETIELRVRVKNIGTVEATEGVVSIHQTGEKNVELRRAHVPLPTLKPKEESTALLLLVIPPSFDDTSFDLGLTIADVTYRVFLTQPLTFNVLPREETRPRHQTVAVKEALAPIYALPFSASLVTARASKGLILSSPNPYGEFLRVQLPRDAFGWIRKESVGPPTALRSKAEKGEVEWAFLQAPGIKTDLEEKVFTPVESQFLNFGGEISDNDSVKDLFVFVNQKKVFYQNFQDAASEKRNQKFVATIPLDPGMNRIITIARDQNDLMQRKTVILQRLGAEEAELPSPETEEEQSEELDDFSIDPPY